MSDPELSPEEDRLKAAFIAARGYWRGWNSFMLRHNPGFLDLYARYAGYPSAQCRLSPKTIELIYVALDSSATHLFASGLLLHLKLAIKAGASTREIMDVLRLATAQGLTGTMAGASILSEEMANVGMYFAGEMPLTEGQHAAKQRYLRLSGGEWPPSCEAMLRADPDYFELVCELLEPERDGEGLEPETRLFVEIALNSCFTGFNSHALRAAIRVALRSGTDPRKILNVLQLTAHLGVHACTVGIPLLEQALEETGGA